MGSNKYLMNHPSKSKIVTWINHCGMWLIPPRTRHAAPTGMSHQFPNFSQANSSSAENRPSLSPTHLGLSTKCLPHPSMQLVTATTRHPAKLIPMTNLELADSHWTIFCWGSILKFNLVSSVGVHAAMVGRFCSQHLHTCHQSHCHGQHMSASFAGRISHFSNILTVPVLQMNNK